MRLKDKTAIVTGAGRGIGKAIAKKFLQEGAKVLICEVVDDRLESAKQDLEQYGEVYAKKVDVTKREQIEDVVSYAKEKMGRIDILANNAGVVSFDPFLEIEDEAWYHTIEINLNGVFLFSQIVAKEMAKQNSGAIINMSSTNGLFGEKELAHYNASKAGVKLLTKTMAMELAEYNIRVNNVCP